jgi:hypothetical protein
MKNIGKIQLLLGLILLFQSCDQEDRNINFGYWPCCGIDPYEYDVEFPDGSKAYVYVPNVFTPNGDGINDKFAPLLTDQLDHFENLVIRKEDANGNRILLYQTEIIDANNIKEKSWDGRDQNYNLHKGIFSYIVICVTKSGKVFGVQSTACSVICDDEASTIFKNKLGCFFSSQSNSNGHLIKTISSRELDCF